MRLLFLLSLLIASTVSNAQTNPFLNLKSDSVVFYDFRDIGEKGSMIVDCNGENIQSVIKQVRLDAATIKSLGNKLWEKRSYGGVTASCFDPHCGFVYFRKGIPVSQVTICLSCNRLYSTLDIPAKKQGRLGEGKDIYYALDGLSKSFRKYLNALLIANKFTHQIEPGSAFDE